MSKKEEIKKELLVTLINNEVIIDTIMTSDKQTHFIVFDRKSKTITYENELEIGTKTYIPISPYSPFLKSWSILLPTTVIKYWTKQELLKDISDYIYKYVDVPKEYIIISSYYVLLTYIYDNFSEIPYLRVIWDYGSGKSRLLKTIWSICYNPMITNWWTSLSAIFRMIEKFKWTLVIDEADMIWSDTNNDMIKLYNNWYQKWQPIMRADWVWFEVNCYEVYCPKIIGGRMEFKDKATESRCLTNIMKKSNRQDIPISITQDFYNESQTLRNKLMKFRYDYYDTVTIENINIEWLEPRLVQIINPILSLIEKDSTKEIIINFLKWKQKDIIEERRQSVLWVVLNIIYNKFQTKTEIYYKDLLDDIEVMEWNKNITSRKLWSMLKQNRLKWFRKNDWTILEYENNKTELERLYREYWII